ncbi:MAG TPA: FecR domain-containing protein [Candidatus Goldiibacteriota bacterium]|nr:FecR domain-containing protein [Candidatus Goldiibacteriota bacterium]
MKNRLFFVFLFLLLFLTGLKALNNEDYSIAYINDYEGDCELKRKGQSMGEAILDIYIPLYEGDMVITGYDSYVEIVFDDATIVKLDPNSKLVVRTLKREKENKTVIELIKGRLMGVINKLKGKEEFAVKTKLAMAAVKGTELIVETGDEDSVGVFEGRVEVVSYNDEGNVKKKIILNKNQETKIVKYIGPGEPGKLSKNYVKRYKEIKDIREKIEYVRKLRMKEEIKEYKLKRRLDRIDKLRMMKNNPEIYKSMSLEQKKLVDEMIKLEPYYQAQLDEEKKKDRKTKIMIKKYKDGKDE